VQLDCHSRESALQSISRIFAAPAVDIDAYLACVDLDAYYEEHDPDTSPDRTITALLEEALGRTSSEVTEVFWFHLTRVLPGEDFMKGIQPLDDALDGIWRLLFKVFEESEHFKNLNDLRNSGVPNFQYRLRVGKPFHCGPYAMLVREAAFRAEEIGNHDYLAVPEIGEKGSSLPLTHERQYDTKTLITRELRDALSYVDISNIIYYKDRHAT